MRGPGNAPSAFKAACIQLRSGLEPARNVADATELIEEAAAAGARLIATPEMTNVLDQEAARLFSVIAFEDDTREVETFAALAARLKIWLLIGSMAVKLADRRAANRAFVYDPDGRIAARYDKIHMFDVVLPDGERWRESALYQAGSHVRVVDTPLAKLGLSICYDVRFPGLYRAMAQAGADILCVPAAFTKQTGEAHWSSLLRARAIENGAFVLAPAQGGRHEDGRRTYGHSMIIDPWGRVLAESPDDAPGVILADISPSASLDARRAIPNLGLEPAYEVLNGKV